MTLFQKSVYNMVRRIPRGKTMTYARVAAALGRPMAFRAVGNALHKNLNSEVPCHRVIKSDGTLGGYNRGSNKKRELLEKEGSEVRGRHLPPNVL